MKRVSIVAMVILLAIGQAGCSTGQKIGLAGAAGGAVIGTAWASTAGILSTAEGTMVGAASGGWLASIFGDAIDQQEAEAAELAHRDVVDGLEQELAKASTRIGELQGAIARGGNADNSAQLASAQARLRELQQQLDTATARLASNNDTLLDRNKRLIEAERLVAARNNLIQKKEGDLAASNAEIQRLSDLLGDKIEVERRGNTIILTFAGEILFDSGKASIKPTGKAVLDRAGIVLNENFADHHFNVEGHTDNVPIRHSGYRSNWELSAARSFSVLHYLVGSHNVSPERLSASAYAYTRPVASNDTADGRRKNRRAVIVIFPKKVKFEHQQLDVDSMSTADASDTRF